MSPKFHLIEMRDGKGLKWTFTYDSDTKLKRIANQFGRWIEIERGTVNGIVAITRIYSNDGRQVIYNYSAWTGTSSIVLAGASYPANEEAVYTWVTANPASSTARPLLASASDPKYKGAGARSKYVYNYDASYPDSFGLVTGTIKEERNLDTDQLVLTLPGGGGGYPQILEGDGTEIVRKVANGQLVESRDGEDRATLYTYGSEGFGFLETKTEPNGAVTTYTRDYAGRVLTETNGLGYVRSFTYNAAGFVLSETDELDRTTAWTRDGANRPTRKDYPGGSYETWTYNTNGQPLTHRFRNGGSEAFAYDSGGNVSTHTDALGNITSYVYTPGGLRSSATDARSNSTSHTYNWRGQMLTVTHADNSIASYQYDAFGNRTAVTNELGHSTSSTYDEYNRLKTVTDPLSRTTTFEYGRSPGCGSCGGASDLVSRIISPSGRTTEYQYDRSGLRTAQTVGAGTPEAATTTYGYDSGKNLVTVMDPNGKVWNYEFDLLGRKTSAIDPLGNRREWTYDAVGNKLTEKRPDGGVTSFEYDARNRLTRTTDPLGQTTEMTYDAGDNLLTMTDARSNTYTYSYDLLNRKLALQYPDNSVESYSYDGTGKPVGYITRAGQVKTSTYDNRNRETGFTWSDATPAVTKTYDAAGRVLTLNNSVSALSYAYDAAGQLLSETQNISGGPGPKTVSYTYTGDGQRLTLAFSGASALAYGYTGSGELGTISVNDAPPLVTYQYDAAGNRAGKTLDNGTAATYQYDDAKRLLTVDHQKNGASFAKYDHTYNAVDNRTSREETVNNQPVLDVYGYDATDQVTQVKYNFDSGSNAQDRLVTYNYDAVGNRSGPNGVTDPNIGNIPYATNTLNQYTVAGNDLPTYDSSGNLATQAGWTYLYDGQNRITRASATGTTVDFRYDARNRCVSRTTNSVTTRFFYDGWKLVEEQSATGVVLAQYVHGANVDEIIEKLTATDAQYYHHDALGSTTALTSSAGILLERYTYDIYGAPTTWNPAGASIPTSAFANRYLFTCREWISELSLYDYRNRIYSPQLGRFLQTDPLRFKAGDVNIYRYVFNNPCNWIDPLGLGCICDGDGKWQYDPTTGSPDSDAFEGNSVGYINADITKEIDEKCYDCDSNGAVLVDHECITKARDCTMIARLKVSGDLPDDYPDPPSEHCQDPEP